MWTHWSKRRRVWSWPICLLRTCMRSVTTMFRNKNLSNSNLERAMNQQMRIKMRISPKLEGSSMMSTSPRIFRIMLQRRWLSLLITIWKRLWVLLKRRLREWSRFLKKLLKGWCQKQVLIFSPTQSRIPTFERLTLTCASCWGIWISPNWLQIWILETLCRFLLWVWMTCSILAKTNLSSIDNRF